jgi:tRNA G18 (ribose-2'-O)-methylase SpoU
MRATAAAVGVRLKRLAKDVQVLVVTQSPQVAALADQRVAIPMVAGAESLNVAAAAAVCLYQSARAQRHRLG